MKTIKELLNLIEDYVEVEEELDQIIYGGTEIIDALNKKGIVVEDSKVYYGGKTLTLFFDKGLKISISQQFDDTYEVVSYNVENNKTDGAIAILKMNITIDSVVEAIETSYNEALNQEPSKDKKIELETNFENGVEVSSDSTSFVRLKFLEALDNKQVEDNFKKLLKLCRENKIQVKGRKNAVEKLAVYPQYKADVEKYNDGVKELQEIWKNIVKEGIFIGCNDDKRLKEAHEKDWTLDKLVHNGATPIYKYTSIARDIKDKLDKLEYQVEHPDSYSRLTMIGF